MDTSEPVRELAPRWRELLTRLGATDDEGLLAELASRRVAHALRHVDELEHRAQRPELVELVIWAAGTERCLDKLELPDSVRADARRLLAVLEDHDPAPDDADGQVASDADLAALSAPADEYRRYVQQLGLEPALRLSQLDALLERDSIYRTPEMRAGREARAQLNLARERAALMTTVNSAKSPRARDPIR